MQVANARIAAKAARLDRLRRIRLLREAHIHSPNMCFTRGVSYTNFPRNTREAVR